jgi:clan AA aspartic protease
MGLVYADIELLNAREMGIKSIYTTALVDTGALHLCIPENIAYQLNLSEFEKRPVTFANGETKMCSYVGPICVKYKNRTSFTGAMVLGNEVLLGAIPMEDMDLVIIPSQLKIDVNPLHPNYPASVAK